MLHKNKKVTVCVTIFNEPEETVNKLLNALNNQTLKPDEIIIIDAKDYDNCSRSKGRNIAIKKAKNEIIAITDAGCTPHKDWLEKITDPFKKTDSEVVAGGYQMVAQNNFEKAEAVFLGVKQQDIKSDFLPSARSMSFTKSIWKKAGGFPENLNDTAEDTVFNMKLIDAGARFVVARDAIVDWQMPKTIKEFANKIYRYAKGDAVSGIWWHPLKKWKTHNIKVLTIFMRYLILILLFLFNKQLCFVFFAGYIIYAFRKAGLWGICLQFISDFSCIIGFSHGILSNRIKRS
ncbi:MAG: glycosyltransferase [Microgenomates group bacterium]